MGWWCNSLNAKQYVKKKRFRTSGLPKLHCSRFKTRKHAGEFITYLIQIKLDLSSYGENDVAASGCNFTAAPFMFPLDRVRKCEPMNLSLTIKYLRPEAHKAESSVIKEIYSFPPHLHF